MSTEQDLLHRYLFDERHVRGELVQLSDSFNEMLENHNYPAVIKRILGELLSVTSLLTATIKFEGDIKGDEIKGQAWDDEGAHKISVRITRLADLP